SQCQSGGNSSPDCGFGSSRSSVAASAATGTDVITSSATSSRPIQDRKWSISIDIFSVPAIWSPSQLHIGKIADSVAVGLVGIAENRNVDEMGGRPIWPNVAIDLARRSTSSLHHCRMFSLLPSATYGGTPPIDFYCPR